MLNEIPGYAWTAYYCSVIAKKNKKKKIKSYFHSRPIKNDNLLNRIESHVKALGVRNKWFIIYWMNVRFLCKECYSCRIQNVHSTTKNNFKTPEANDADVSKMITFFCLEI